MSMITVLKSIEMWNYMSNEKANQKSIKYYFYYYFNYETFAISIRTRTREDLKNLEVVGHRGDTVGVIVLSLLNYPSLF